MVDFKIATDFMHCDFLLASQISCLYTVSMLNSYQYLHRIIKVAQKNTLATLNLESAPKRKKEHPQWCIPSHQKCSINFAVKISYWVLSVVSFGKEYYFQVWLRSDSERFFSLIYLFLVLWFVCKNALATKRYCLLL